MRTLAGRLRACGLSISLLLSTAGCVKHETGIVVLREWTRQVVQEREECVTTMHYIWNSDGTMAGCYPITSCDWVPVNTWTRKGNDDKPTWPVVHQTEKSNTRYRHVDENLIVVRQPGGLTRELHVSEPDLVKMAPGTAWSFDRRLWSARNVSKLNPEE